MFQRHRCADRGYMQRNLVSSLISAFALGLSCAGCASHPAVTVINSTPVPFLPFHSGALLGVVTAAAIDRHARPLKVSTAFAETAKQIVAVAFVGKVPSGSQVTIAWEAYDPVGGVREMFAQRVRVSSFQRAYSTAVAKGRLTLGSYRVHVTLGDQEIETPFNVAELVRGRPAPTGPPDDPAPGASGAEDADLCVPQCNDQPSASVGPCASVTSVYGEGMGPVVDAHIFADPSQCRGGVTLAATVRGPFKVVLTNVGGYIDNTIDPCDLPGGNDEPGTVVQLEGYAAGHESEAKHGEVTLIDINPFPLIEGSSQPQTGTKVKPGDTIHFRVSAVEVPATTGVRSLTATTNFYSRLVQDKIDTAKPCTMSKWGRVVDFVLTVPKKPPPVIEVHFVARDFATRQSTLTAYYPTTGHLWKGTISATATLTTHVPCVGGPLCVNGIVRTGPFIGYYDGTLELVEDTQGAIKGKGHVIASGCERPEIPPAWFVFFEVTGTDNGKELQLQIVPSTLHADGPTCGFAYGWADVPDSSPSSAVIPITALGTAQGALHAHAEEPPSPPGPFSTASMKVDYRVALTCADCQESH